MISMSTTKRKEKITLAKRKICTKRNYYIPPNTPKLSPDWSIKNDFCHAAVTQLFWNKHQLANLFIYLAFLSYLLSSGRILIVPWRRNPQMCDEDKRLTLHLSFASTTSFSTPAYFLRASAIKETSTMPTSVSSKTSQSVENYAPWGGRLDFRPELHEWCRKHYWHM